MPTGSIACLGRDILRSAVGGVLSISCCGNYKFPTFLAFLEGKTRIDPNDASNSRKLCGARWVAEGVFARVVTWEILRAVVKAEWRCYIHYVWYWALGWNNLQRSFVQPADGMGVEEDVEDVSDNDFWAQVQQGPVSQIGLTPARLIWCC